MESADLILQIFCRLWT